MSKKIQKSISVLTSITTIAWLSGVAMLAPIAVSAAVVDGDIVSPDAEFTEGDITYYPYDVFIVKIVGSKTFKRLILNPEVFESYGHLEWGNIQTISASTVEGYTLSSLVRELNDEKVYKLTADGDTGTKGWLNMTAAEFETDGYDWDSIYVINVTDRDNYTTGSSIVAGGGEESPVTSTGTLSVTLAADTPAAGIAVGAAARMPFTKVNLTATGGDVIVDSLVVQRVGLANDLAFSSIDIVDGGTNLPLNITSKTFNSLHQATFNDNFTVSNGTTKSVILAANMAARATLAASYSGEVPALSLVSIALSGDATLSASLPLTGNSQTINGTITIGSATIQRGAYGNATSSPQVGKEDYTYFSFQVQAGSEENIQFSQVKVYQEGSASLGTDLIDLELLQDGTKIADGIIASAKYANFSFDPITLTKGQIAQFQVKGTVADGSARTIILGIYKTTDLLVKGLTYGYNVTPTYSGTGSSASSPVLSDNEFTISNGTLQVTRSSSIGAGNIGVANDQYLGAFTFTVKGEVINVSTLDLTITSATNPGNGSDAILNVELVDPNGNVVAGPTDPGRATGLVEWTDTFSVPVGETIYKVRGDLQTSADWASDDNVYVTFTPSAMTATGETTGNAITASPSSSLSGNTQTVKAASLTVTRNTLPAAGNIIVGQKDLTLTSWRFDASDSGEDIRVTSIGFTAKAAGNAATNTNALTIYVDDVAQSPINDAIADDSTGAFDAASSTFALEEPVIITKGTYVTVELHGDKDTVASNDTEAWGMGGDSVTAYGVSTGNSVTVDITGDNGPTLTSVVNGTLTIETSGNPSSAIVLTGSTGNVFTNIKLSADYEDLRLDQLIVHVIDGGYSFTTGHASDYNDVVNVGIYDGIELLAQSSIPQTNQYTFNFNAGDLTIPRNSSKTLTIKVDMSTVNKSTDNAPGTNSADLIVGLNGAAAGIKTTGMASNAEITGTYEDFRSSSSSIMIMRTSKPTVTLPTASNSLGAATTLVNGNVVIYAYDVTAAGGDVLLFRNTFVFATTGVVALSNVYITDEDGNTISSASGALPEAADADHFNYDGTGEWIWTTNFDDPVVSIDNDTEAIRIASGETKRFKLHATVAGATTGDNLTVFLAGDPTPNVSGDLSGAKSAMNVGVGNFAVATTTITTVNHGWKIPGALSVAASHFGQNVAGDLSSTTSSFIWSDNFTDSSISGTDNNNATSSAQWYNGHLVPGLGNVVSTTAYVIAF